MANKYRSMFPCRPENLKNIFMIKTILIIVQTATIILLSVVVVNMKSDVTKMSDLLDKAAVQLKISKHQMEVAQKNVEMAVEITQKCSEKLKLYSDAYGPIIMPGESMHFEYTIPISH